MKIKLTDANNVIFELDNNFYMKMNDDLSSDSNAPFVANQENAEPVEISMTIENSDGSDFNITDSDDTSDIQSIDVYLEASHTNTLINNGKYTDNSMLRDAESYMFPYGKPMLKNHNDHSEPLGRIKNSQCIDSVSLPGTKALDVQVNVVDKDAMTKFLDGRYNTVSIGAYPKTITCNHCGKPILKDGKFNFCGHMRGQVYEDKKCTWTLEDLEYTELSVVNTPADRYAQVYKIVVNKKKAKDDDTKNDSKTGDSLTDDILVALTDNEENIVTPDENEENNADCDENVAEDNNDDDNNDDDNNINDSENEFLNKKISDLEMQLAQLISDNDSFREQIDVLTTDNEFLNNKNEKLTNNIEVISKSYKNDLLSVVNRFSNNVQEDINFKELKEIFNGLEYKPSQPKQVINPGLVDNSNDGVIIKDKDVNIASSAVKDNENFNSVISLYNY